MTEDNFNPLEELNHLYNGDWKEWRSDPTKNVVAPPFLFSYNNIGVCPLGDIQAVAAHAKNGKTYAGSILMAAALGDKSLGWKCNVPDAKVLFIDTEQAEYNTIIVQQRIYKMTHRKPSLDDERFQTMRCRGKSPEEIVKNVQNAINDFHPTLVWLDGIRDLVNDFNDVSEGSEIVRTLMQLAEDNQCAIMNVLHLNKGDENMRGHLGSELLNKVSDQFTIKKVKEIGEIYFEVEQAVSRNQDMDTFTFQINGVGMPTLKQIAEETKMELKDLFREIIPQGSPKKYADLVRLVVKKATNIKSDSGAKKLIKEAFEQRIIETEPLGKIIYVGDNKQPIVTPEEEEAPF